MDETFSHAVAKLVTLTLYINRRDVEHLFDENVRIKFYTILSTWSTISSNKAKDSVLFLNIYYHKIKNT